MYVLFACGRKAIIYFTPTTSLSIKLGMFG